MSAEAVRVEVHDAAIAFGDDTVFSGLSASFEAGHVTALVGPSGSGKSSLLAAIAGHQPLARGRVEIHRGDGADPHRPSAALVAWVPQGSNALGRRDVLDNVLIASLADGRPMSRARAVAMTALDQVGLADRASEQARRLSGGELQRVALARALASGRPLVLADEPSANLDAANTDMVADILARVVSQATIIVATHDPILVEAATASVHLRGGSHE
ncbi:ATP-binding cassette domain-containing protein [Pseudactinotalea sp. HY158]|uniref:ATP-binding cassette domain-containing protein n=1 Tax=Pseudactinotalea sp. HY158 TaxID=2654547 RepID=UPI0018926266|nr:ATP-binding cassette domain-containing protein [Pseudactinotalea sp. HY158]